MIDDLLFLMVFTGGAGLVLVGIGWVVDWLFDRMEGEER